MKRINILLILLIAIICSCENSNSDAEIELGENKQSAPMETCNCDSLGNETGLFTIGDQTFTGMCYLNYPMSDQRYIEKQILDGKIHGNVIYYDKNNNVLFEEMYINGEQDKIENYCNCSELVEETKGELKKSYLKGKPFSGSCEDFFPNSEQAYLEATYLNGQLNGYVNYYAKDGKVVMIQKYEMGELVKDIVPTN